MSVSSVVIVDYGIGNIHSVTKAFRAAGAEPIVTTDPETARRADRLVVPGVGAFADCMRSLLERGFDRSVRDFIATGRPFLGICVGLQMLFAESREFGTHAGLGILEGVVDRLSEADGIKVPHIGWNPLEPSRDWTGTLLHGRTPGDRAYFVHSFAAIPARESDRLADTQHGPNRICAAVQRDNIMGTQFHPEKSGDLGLAILGHFVTLA